MAERDFGKAVELAGFFLAHAVWSVHEGGPLVPLVAFENAQGRNMVRFAAEDSRQGVMAAQQFLTANEPSATHAVMVCDAFVTYGDVRKDTLIASVVAYGEPEQSLTIGIPYTPATDAGPFAVHRPDCSVVVEKLAYRRQCSCGLEAAEQRAVLAAALPVA